MQSTQVCCYDSIPKNGLRQCPNRTMKGKVYALSLQVQGRWHRFFSATSLAARCRQVPTLARWLLSVRN